MTPDSIRLFGDQVLFPKAIVASDHHFAIALLRRLHDVPSLVVRASERLLDDHVLASSQRRNSLLVVEHIGRSDDDEVYVLLVVQHASVVVVNMRNAPLRSRPKSVLLDRIAGGQQLRLRNLLDGREMSQLGDAARTDHRHSDGLASCRRIHRFRSLCCLSFLRLSANEHDLPCFSLRPSPHSVWTEIVARAHRRRSAAACAQPKLRPSARSRRRSPRCRTQPPGRDRGC